MLPIQIYANVDSTHLIWGKLNVIVVGGGGSVNSNMGCVPAGAITYRTYFYILSSILGVH